MDWILESASRLEVYGDEVSLKRRGSMNFCGYKPVESVKLKADSENPYLN